jgi:hypothetical protein
MAKINLSGALGQIVTQIQNTEASQVKALLGDLSNVQDSVFAGIINSEGDGLTALAEFAALLGVSYQGTSLSFWENQDGVGCRPPAIHSNGTQVIVDWGGSTAVLSGQLTGKVLSGDIRLTSDTATLRINLRTNGDLKQEGIEDILADAEKWEDLLPALKVYSPFKPGKELYSGAYTDIKVVSFSQVENEKGSYIAVLGDCNGETFRFAMPDDALALLSEGATVTVDTDKHALILNGQEFSGGGFFKMGELQLGRVFRATEVKESGGEYGGLYLVVPNFGNVNCNSQMTRYLNETNPDVSPANPLEFKVVNVRTMKDGKRIAKLAISMPNDPAVGLAALIGKAPAAAPAPLPKVAPAPKAEQKAVAAGDDWIS